MKKHFLFPFLLLCSLASQSQVISFGKEYPIWSEYGLNNFQQTSDGGYILCTDAVPEMDPSPTPLGRGYLVKMDAQGNTQWIKTYPKTTFPVKCFDGNSVFQTADGGYIIGTSIYFPSPALGYASAFLLIKTDNLGNPIWSKTYPGKGSSTCFCVKQTSDLGYIACGITQDSTTYHYYSYLLKTDASGNPQWGKTFAEPSSGQNSFAYCVKQTSDNGYIVTGDSYSGSFVIKTDTAGTILWSSNFGTPGSVALRNILQSSDGGYIAAGYGANFNNHVSALLVKYNAGGTMQWRNSYTTTLSSTSSYDEGFAVEEVSDGFVLLTLSDAFNTGLVKTDSAGNAQWGRTYTTGVTSMPMALEKTADGGLAFAVIWGDAYMPNTGNQIIKTDSLGFLSCDDSLLLITDTVYLAPSLSPFVSSTISPASNYPVVFTNVMVNDSTFCMALNPKGIEDILSENAVSVFPNPSSGNFTVEINSLKGNSIRIEVYDVLGQMVMEKKEENVPGNFHESLDLSVMPDGIYFVAVKVDDRIVVVKKIIKQN
jgi:hypothetical protein